MKFPELIATQQRRDILRLLLQIQPHFRASNRVLYSGLSQDCEFPPSQSVVDDHIAWLAEHLLVTREDLGEGIVRVTLLQRGKDVALGNSQVPGVAGPEPAL